MSIVISEKEILSQKAPQGGVWTEDMIRQYQESNGVNYGQAVFCEGVKPTRRWSNDRHFNNVVVQENAPAPVEDQSATIQALKDQIAAMKLSQMHVPDEIPSFTGKGVERHGLKKSA